MNELIKIISKKELELEEKSKEAENSQLQFSNYLSKLKSEETLLKTLKKQKIELEQSISNIKEVKDFYKFSRNEWYIITAIVVGVIMAAGIFASPSISLAMLHKIIILALSLIGLESLIIYIPVIVYSIKNGEIIKIAKETNIEEKEEDLEAKRIELVDQIRKIKNLTNSQGEEYRKRAQLLTDKKTIENGLNALYEVKGNIESSKGTEEREKQSSFEKSPEDDFSRALK